MSDKARAWVEENSATSGNDRVVMMILAGVANDDYDHRIWYSVATLARKANVSARTIQRSLRALVELGELEECAASGTPLAGERADRRPIVYRMTFRSRGDKLSPGCERPRGDRTRHHGVTEQAPRGDTVVTQSQENTISISPRGTLASSLTPDDHPQPSSKQRCIAAFVRGYGERRHGNRPPSKWINAAARGAGEALADGRAVDDLEVVFETIGREGKHPSTLWHVLGDYDLEGIP